VVVPVQRKRRGTGLLVMVLVLGHRLLLSSWWVVSRGLSP
jgi:hypothetical protein